MRMSAVLDPHGAARAAAGEEPLARRIARAAASASHADLPAQCTAKVKLCLIDLIGCAFEAAHLPWSRQAAQLAVRAADGATVIGEAGAFAHADAAFANAVMGHGLVREDMHPGSISHLGIVVLPTLLAL
jgi:2-methylcitrate dehydratase PrpD